MMTLLLLAVALVRQDEPVESLVRKLGSENVQEREKAADELKRRGDAAMDALLRAEKRAAQPAEKEKFRRALEEVLGYRPLTAERVRSVRVTCALRKVKTRAAAAELQKLAGFPVEVDAPPDIDPAIPELEAADQPLDRVLDSLAKQAAGYWLADGRRVLLVLPGKVPIRIFDARDLIESVLDEPHLSLEPDESGLVSVSEEPEPPVTGEDLANLLRADVSPARWEEADGKSISFENGWLIVRNDAEVLRGVEAALGRYRRRFLAEVRLEIEAYAVKAGTNVEETGIERLREEAAEGKTVRRVASFERTARNGRRIALSSLTRHVFVTGYDESGVAVTEPYCSGAKANVRALVSEDRATVRIELEAGWSRLLSVEKRKETMGDVQIPTFATHTLQPTLGVAAGRFALLGRVGETRIVEGLGDLVVVGRFTPVERE